MGLSLKNKQNCTSNYLSLNDLAFGLTTGLPPKLLGGTADIVLEVFAEERLRGKVETSGDLLDAEIRHLQQGLRLGNHFLHNPLTG